MSSQTRRSRPSEPGSCLQSCARVPPIYQTFRHEPRSRVSRNEPPDPAVCGSHPDPFTSASELDLVRKCPRKIFPRPHVYEEPNVPSGQMLQPDSVEWPGQITSRNCCTSAAGTSGAFDSIACPKQQGPTTKNAHSFKRFTDRSRTQFSLL